MVSDPIGFLLAVIDELEEAGFFKETGISKEALISQMLKVMNHNLATDGSYHMTEDDLSNVYEKAMSDTIDAAMQDALQKGLVDIAGVDDEGQLIYHLSEKGNELSKELSSGNHPIIVTAQFERFKDFEPHCLN